MINFGSICLRSCCVNLSTYLLAAEFVRFASGELQVSRPCVRAGTILELFFPTFVLRDPSKTSLLSSARLVARSRQSRGLSLLPVTHFVFRPRSGSDG